MSKPKCSTCRFWERLADPDFNEWGLCRRNAPVPFVTTQAECETDDSAENKAAWWPRTIHNDWCGEHQPSVEPPPS